MSDTTTTTVDAYIDAWNEQDAERRTQLIARAWAEDGAYVDPALAAKGHAGIGEMVDGVHAQFPGHRFRRTSEVDEHNGLVRFAWELADEGGTVAVAGIDVGVLAEDGRLQRVAGFFGELTAVAGAG